MSQEFVASAPIETEDTGNSLVSADRVAGTIVYDLAGDRIGAVDSVMIDKISGTVAYVVVSFGSNFGGGGKSHPLPWDMLKYDTGIDGYRADIGQGDLEGAPSYDRDALAGFGDRHRKDVDYFYRPASDDDDDGFNRSDLNDGIDRPLGFYSRKAQALRSGHVDAAGAAHTPNLRADQPAPGFYSPEQQQARSNINALQEQIRQPDPTLNEIDGRNDAAGRWPNGQPGPGVG